MASTRPAPTHKTQTLLLWIAVAIAIIGLVGASSYLFLSQNNTKQKDTSSTTNPSSTSPSTITPPSTSTPPIAATQVLKIPELGVQMTLPSGLDGLQYTIDRSIQGIVIANLTTTALLEADPACKAGALGGLALYQTDPKQMQASVVESKQVKNFYVAYATPQQPCSMNDSINTIELKQVSLIREEVFNSISPITQ